MAQRARWVIKIGSALLTNDGRGLDRDLMQVWVDRMVALRERGIDVMVVSSGAVAEGMTRLGWARRPDSVHQLQAAAAVGQMGLVQAWESCFQKHRLHTAQVLLTHDDLSDRKRYLNARSTLLTLLGFSVVPVVNENDTVVTDEIRFGDNDRLAALVAHLVHADLLVLLSDVDGLYDGPPTREGARLLGEVRDETDLEAVSIGSVGAAGVGTGGMVTKVEAARIATGAGIPVVLTSAERAGEALSGTGVGTLFHATGRRRPTRLLWLAHATESRGALHLDAGAVRAVVERRASLLAAGLTGASGSFVAGDPVDLAGPDGTVVARGLVNFDAEEVPALVGRSTAQLKEELGAAYEREVVHRDDLVLLTP